MRGAWQGSDRQADMGEAVVGGTHSVHTERSAVHREGVQVFVATKLVRHMSLGVCRWGARSGCACAFGAQFEPRYTKGRLVLTLTLPLCVVQHV